MPSAPPPSPRGERAPARVELTYAGDRAIHSLPVHRLKAGSVTMSSLGGAEIISGRFGKTTLALAAGW